METNEQVRIGYRIIVNEATRIKSGPKSIWIEAEQKDLLVVDATKKTILNSDEWRKRIHAANWKIKKKKKLV